MYLVLSQAADALKKEVQQLSALKPHDRIVTYVGTCYAMHPTFNVESLIRLYRIHAWGKSDL